MTKPGRDTSHGVEVISGLEIKAAAQEPFRALGLGPVVTSCVVLLSPIGGCPGSWEAS